ncbi:MAG: glycosyltransferase [Mastigocoleus sp.]
MLELSVVIPCLNAEKTIENQLEAMISQEWSQPWELIIADNSSTDNTLNIIQKYQNIASHIRIVNASSKPGAGYARNAGAKAACSESLAFCDADDVVHPGWVTAMGEALIKYDYVGGRNEHLKLNDSWIVKTYSSPGEDGVFFEHPYLPLVSGSNFGIKRSLHESIGGFDENLMILEDVDYSWRLQEAGIKVHEIETAIIHFRFRNSILSICRRAWAMGCYEARLYQKHLPMGIPQLISWKTLVKTAIMSPWWFLSQVRDKVTLAKYLMDLSWRAGQLQGCIKYKYLPF